VPITHTLYPVEKFTPPDLPLFAEYVPGKHDVSDWYWSEKKDGVRCVWNGKMLMTRNGNSVRAPDEFVNMLPKGVKLDGELAGPHGTFEQCLEALQIGPPCSFWNHMRFYVFDMPTREEIPFRDRYQKLRQINHSYPGKAWRVLSQHKVDDLEQLEQRLVRMTRDGVEGIVLRNPDGFYKKGRHVKVGLKWKVIQIGRGEIVEVAEKEGSYVIRERGGQTFTLHVSPHDNESLRVGSAINFGHRGRTASGKPKFPNFESTSS
jgi:DNA ligase-1